MKQPTDQFLYGLALFEIHRHTPGVLKQIASKENPNGIPLSEAFFVVSYAFLPPTILVKSYDDVLNTPGQKEETRAVMQHIVDIVRKDGGKSVPLQIHAHRGGHIPTITTHLMPGSILQYGQGKVHAGTEKVQHISRKPARDITKKSLPFILDEVDLHVADARKNYRQSNTSDEEPSSSSTRKTIYHYAEEQVASNKYSGSEEWKLFMQLVLS